MPATDSIFLADGGIHNNLATSAFDVNRSADVLLVVDSSAPLETAALRHLTLPIVAEVGAIARSMLILYNNTVEPRIENLEMQGVSALSETAESMFPLVVRMTDNTSDGLKRIGRMATAANVLPNNERPSDLFRESWQPLRHHWGEAAKYMSERHFHRTMAALSHTVPTTFNSIDRTKALGLIVHGYLLTMMSMSFTDGSPNGSLDMSRFERLVDLQIGDSPAFLSHLDPL